MVRQAETRINVPPGMLKGGYAETATQGSGLSGYKVSPVRHSEQTPENHTILFQC